MDSRPWHQRKRLKARELMLTLGMGQDPSAEGKCPKCDRVLNDKGNLVDRRIMSKTSHHIGSIKCLTQTSRKESIMQRINIATLLNL